LLQEKVLFYSTFSHFLITQKKKIQFTELLLQIIMNKQHEQQNEQRILPADFTLQDRCIVIGKGKKFYHHPGNEWLRKVVKSKMSIYSQATTKSEKSSVISDMIDYVTNAGFKFVKLAPTSVPNQWMIAEPLLQREKVSQTFRDNLAQTYRSSNVAKRNKRRQQQQQQQQQLLHCCTAEDHVAKRRRTVSPFEDDDSMSWFDWETPAANATACSDLLAEENVFGPEETLLEDSNKLDEYCWTMMDLSSSFNVQYKPPHSVTMPSLQPHQSRETDNMMTPRRMWAFAA